MASAQHGFQFKDYILYSRGVTIGSGESRLVVTKDIPVSDAASLHFSMYIDIESISLGVDESIKFYLQKLVNDQWVDVGDPQAVVEADSGDGTYCIVLTEGIEMEAMVLPLTNVVRLAVDSGANSTATVTGVSSYDRI
jgi:hypothetical protein